MRIPLRCLCAVLLSVAVDGSAKIASAQSGDGSPDDAFWDDRISPSLPGVDGNIQAITVFNGQLIVAGSFRIAGRTPALGIAAWNGGSWSALGSGMNDSRVTALAVFDGKLIAGGEFRSAGGVPANGIAAWDGSSWTPLGAGVANAGYVYALAVFDGKLIAGGEFASAGGSSASGIAAWNGASWSTSARGSCGAVTPVLSGR